MTEPDTRVRPIALLAIAATAVVAGGFIGATTNAVGAAVSPTYFRNVMEWGQMEHVWRAAVALGAFAGLMYGVFFSVILTLVVGVVSRAQCPYTTAARYVLAIMAGVYGAWAVGGGIGVGLAALSPEFFQRTFTQVPLEHAEMLRFGWTGGSTWGAIAGAVLSLTVGGILFGVRWKRAQAASSA